MILSDYSIVEALDNGPLVISPYPVPIQIQPASVDLRLGKDWSWYPPFSGFASHDRDGLVCETDILDEICIDPAKPSTIEMRSITAESFVLSPGAFALGTTLERVEIPANLVGRVEGRSSLGRLGVMVHITAGFIDPGFKGRITLEFHNVGEHPVRLRAGMRICQLSLETMTCAAREPYGTKRGSKYQNQDTTTPSRIAQDEK